MASILDIYNKSVPTTGKIDSKGKEKTPINSLYSKNLPKTGKIDTVGKDKTPIEPDGGLNLSTNESKLLKARGGKLNQIKYSDTVKK